MGRRVWVPVVSGPLAPYAAGFESWLRSRAYSSSTAADRLYQFDQLSRWLERGGLRVGELTGEQAERFVAARRTAGRVTWASPRSVVLPLEYLREVGVAPTPRPAVAEGPLEELLAEYGRTTGVGPSIRAPQAPARRQPFRNRGSPNFRSEADTPR